MEFDNSFDVPLAPAQAWKVLMDIPRIAPCMPGAELTEVIDAQNYKGKISVRLGPVALSFGGRVELDSIDQAKYSARVKAQGSDAKGRGSANATTTFRIEPAGTGSKVLIHTDLMLSGAVAQYGRGVGMIQATAAQIIGQFAANLRTQLAQQPAPPKPPAVKPAPAANALLPGLAGNAATPQAATPRSQAQAEPRPQPPPRSPSQPQTQPQPPQPQPQPLPRPAPPAAAKPISGLSLIARVIWQQIAGLFSGRRH